MSPNRSAAFHNPAGLQGVTGFAFLADLSLLFGKNQASPSADDDARSTDTELLVGPFFLLGAAYRVHEWVSVGLAAFPVGSGGARYRYTDDAGVATEDETALLFFESTPLVSLNVPRDRRLPGRLSLGLGWRVDMLDFARRKGPVGDPSTIDPPSCRARRSRACAPARSGGRPTRSGSAWCFATGSRSMRPTTAVRRSASRSRIPKLTFVLPARLGAGARWQLAALGLAADLEYGFQATNDTQPLRAELDGEPLEIANVLAWRDAITLRAGAEYGLGSRRQFPVRVGYIFDDRVTSTRYPTAFGTPPVATHSVTAGAGWVIGGIQVDPRLCVPLRRDDRAGVGFRAFGRVPVVRRPGSIRAEPARHLSRRERRFPARLRRGCTRCP